MAPSCIRVTWPPWSYNIEQIMVSLWFPARMQVTLCKVMHYRVPDVPVLISCCYTPWQFIILEQKYLSIANTNLTQLKRSNLWLLIEMLRSWKLIINASKIRYNEHAQIHVKLWPLRTHANIRHHTNAII